MRPASADGSAGASMEAFTSSSLVATEIGTKLEQTALEVRILEGGACGRVWLAPSTAGDEKAPDEMDDEFTWSCKNVETFIDAGDEKAPAQGKQGSTVEADDAKGGVACNSAERECAEGDGDKTSSTTGFAFKRFAGGASSHHHRPPPL